jgi:hypothetical protein
VRASMATDGDAGTMRERRERRHHRHVLLDSVWREHDGRTEIAHERLRGTSLVGCPQRCDRAPRHDHRSVVLPLLSIDEACGAQQEWWLKGRGLDDHRLDSRLRGGGCWPGHTGTHSPCHAGTEDAGSTVFPGSSA